MLPPSQRGKPVLLLLPSRLQLPPLSSPASLCCDHHHAASLCYHPLLGCSMTHFRRQRAWPFCVSFARALHRVVFLSTGCHQSTSRSATVGALHRGYLVVVAEVLSFCLFRVQFIGCTFSGAHLLGFLQRFPVHGFFHSTLLTTIAQPTCEPGGVAHVGISFTSVVPSALEAASQPALQEHRHRSAAMRMFILAAKAGKRAARASVPFT